MSRTRARVKTLLRAGLALSLLALVAWHVPWRDRVLWRAEGVELDAPGDIEGGWRADRIRFHLGPEAEAEAGWPAEFEAARASGAPLELARAPRAELGWDWRPGLLRVFREMRPGGLAAALGLLVFAALVAITRWWRLLRVAGCGARWLDALRLTFIGLFMNLVLPGLTSGDVVKAVLVVRENPSRRADALVSVIVDRAIGLIVLLGLAVLVVLFAGERLAELRWTVVGVFVVAVLGAWIVLHPLPRRALGVDRLLARLPQQERLRSIQRALQIYRHHPFELATSVALSVVNHACIISALYVLGHAFGDQLGWIEYLGAGAIANIASSLPIAPGGWGVGEALYGYLFHLLGSDSALGIAVSVSFRLLSTALGLVGGLFLLLPSGRAARAEIGAEAVDTSGPLA